MKRTIIMNQSQNASEPRTTSQSVRHLVTSCLLMLLLIFGARESSLATQQQAKPQAQETVQSIVAKQASLVSEFEVNGLKVLVKRREGSLTVAAGLLFAVGQRISRPRMPVSRA